MKQSLKISVVSWGFISFIMFVCGSALTRKTITLPELVGIIIATVILLLTHYLGQIASVREFELEQCSMSEDEFKREAKAESFVLSGRCNLPMFPHPLRWLFADSQYTHTTINVTKQTTVVYKLKCIKT